jgi:hypothetical protein
MTNNPDLADKRDKAHDRIFGRPTVRSRNAEAAAVSAIEALDRLMMALDAGDQLGDEYGKARAQVDMNVYESAVAFGHVSVDGMQGMIRANIVDQATPMQRRHDQAFGPLDDAWQQSESPHREAGSVAGDQRSQLIRLGLASALIGLAPPVRAFLGERGAQPSRSSRSCGSLPAIAMRSSRRQLGRP